MPFAVDATPNHHVLRFSHVQSDPDMVIPEISALCGHLGVFLNSRGASSREGYALHLALEEVLTNFFKYGQVRGDNAPSPTVNGEVALLGDRITLTIRDNGAPFNPADAPKPALGEDALDQPEGGLGLFLLFETFTHFQYARLGNENLSVWELARGNGSGEK